MDTFQAIFLGIVQGLTEFLPVSSSAHLILVPYFFKWVDPGLGFDIALHMGTLLALLIYFWKDWMDFLRQLFFRKPPAEGSTHWKQLVVGTLPAVVVGGLLASKAEHELRNPLLVAANLAVFGVLLWVIDLRGRKERRLSALKLTDALFIGCAQAFAILPGVSRSGATITMGLLLGLTRPAAARFSFLLCAPIIAGAGLLKARHIMDVLDSGGNEATAMAWGFAASLLAGVAAIGLLNRILKTRTFAGFAVYRLALSLVIIIIIVVVL